jgi:hypothetical protein
VKHLVFSQVVLRPLLYEAPLVQYQGHCRPSLHSLANLCASANSSGVNFAATRSRAVAAAS